LIKAKPAAVYRALTSATELCRWWLQGAETEAHSAGRFRMVWPRLKTKGDGRKKMFPSHVALGDSEGYFVDLEPGRKVGWLWKMPKSRSFPALASFFIEPSGRSSTVTLMQSGFSAAASADKYYAGCAEGWEDCLAKLKLYLETGRSAKSQMLSLAPTGAGAKK
jgi:uncharacterized protein YndB with AHSA1/START domain